MQIKLLILENAKERKKGSTSHRYTLQFAFPSLVKRNFFFNFHFVYTAMLREYLCFLSTIYQCLRMIFLLCYDGVNGDECAVNFRFFSAMPTGKVILDTWSHMRVISNCLKSRNVNDAPRRRG